MKTRSIYRVPAIFLILAFALPGPLPAAAEPAARAALRAGQPRNNATAAGLEESLTGGAWDWRDRGSWRVYAGKSAIQMAGFLAWRPDLTVARLVPPSRMGPASDAERIPLSRAREMLEASPDRCLLVEGPDGGIGLIDGTDPKSMAHRRGEIFNRLRARAVSGVEVIVPGGDFIRLQERALIELFRLLPGVSGSVAVDSMRTTSGQKCLNRAALNSAGEILGVIAAHRGLEGQPLRDGDSAYIAWNVVQPDQRGKGIGRLLMESVLAGAVEQGLRRVHWDSLADEGAQNFYRRIGGVPVRNNDQDGVARVRYEFRLPPAAGLEESLAGDRPEPQLLQERGASGEREFYVGNGRWARTIAPGFGEFTRVLLSALQKPGVLSAGMTALDLGAGEGAAVLGVADSVRRVDGVEIDSGAAERARQNIARNGVTNAEIFEGDLTAPVRERTYDLIVANLPIVPLPPGTKLFFLREPWFYKANSGGPDGRQVLERAMREASGLLNPGGRMIVAHPHFIDLSKTEHLARELGLEISVLSREDIPLENPGEGKAHLFLAFRDAIEAAHGIRFLRKGDTLFYRLDVLEFRRAPAAAPKPTTPAAGLEETVVPLTANVLAAHRERIREILLQLNTGPAARSEVEILMQYLPESPFSFAAFAGKGEKDLVGLVSGYRFINRLEVHNLVVDEPRRGREAGKRLMERVLAKAREEGIRRVILHVENGNREAIRLYENLGFQVDGEQPGSIGGKAVTRYFLRLPGDSPQAGLEEPPSIEMLDGAEQALAALDLKGVLWDFDLTLWTGYPDRVEEEFLAEALGIPLDQEAGMQRMRDFLLSGAGASWDEIVAMLPSQGWVLREGVTHAQFVEQLLRAVDERGLADPGRYLSPGARDLLGAFRERGIPQAIATGGDAESRTQIAGRLGILEFFGAGAVHGDGKKLETIRRQAGAWGCAPNQLALIGDGTKDMIAARQAGILAVGFASSPKRRDAWMGLPPEHRPHLIIHGDFRRKNEILRVLKLSPAAGLEEADAAGVERRWGALIRRAQGFFLEFHGEGWASSESVSPDARKLAEPLHEIVRNRLPQTAALLADGKLGEAARRIREDQARLGALHRAVATFPKGRPSPAHRALGLKAPSYKGYRRGIVNLQAALGRLAGEAERLVEARRARAAAGRELGADLAGRQYPGGPVRMLVEEFTQRDAEILLLRDPEPVHLNNPGYGAFLETVVERLADEAGLKRLLLPQSDRIVRRRLVPLVRGWMRSSIPDFYSYLSKVHRDPEVFTHFVPTNLPSHWLLALRAAVERGIPVVGYDPGERVDLAGIPSGNTRIPLYGGETEARMAARVAAERRAAGPDGAVLVLAPARHMAAVPELGRMGRLLKDRGGFKTVTVWAGFGEGEPAFHDTGLPEVAVSETTGGLLGSLELFRDWPEVRRLEPPSGEPVAVPASDFDRLIYLRDPEERLQRRVVAGGRGLSLEEAAELIGAHRPSALEIHERLDREGWVSTSVEALVGPGQLSSELFERLTAETFGDPGNRRWRYDVAITQESAGGSQAAPRADITAQPARIEGPNEEARRQHIFRSADEFLGWYGGLLANRGLQGEVDKIRQLHPDRVWVVRDRPRPEPVAVLVYVKAASPGWQTTWEGAVRQRLEWVEDQIDKVTFIVAPYPENGVLAASPQIVIREEGATLTGEGGRDAPVLTFRRVDDVREWLTPGLTYAVSVTRALEGRVAGPFIYRLTFQNEEGETLYAIFA